jgi:hypothetical protein
MESGRLVLLTCAAPKEKFWGVLLELAPVGATLRCVPLDAFEDFLKQVREGEVAGIAPITVFLPAHRLERVELDESGGGLEGLGQRFARLTGQDPCRCLLGEAAPGAGPRSM